LLSAGHHHTNRWQEERQADRLAVQSAQQQLQAEQARGQALRDKLTEMVGASEEQMYKAMLELREQWPQIQAEADKAALQQQSAQDRRQLVQFQAQEQARILMPQLQKGLADYLTGYREDSRFEGLTQEDEMVVYRSLWDNRASNGVFVAPTPGNNQWNVNLDVVEKALGYVARIRQQQGTQQTATAAAAAQNQAIVQGGPQQPPPHVPARSSAPGKVEIQVPDFGKLPIDQQTDAVDEWFEHEDFE
jgi:hypothetical protein